MIYVVISALILKYLHWKQTNEYKKDYSEGKINLGIIKANHSLGRVFDIYLIIILIKYFTNSEFNFEKTAIFCALTYIILIIKNNLNLKNFVIVIFVDLAFWITLIYFIYKYLF